MRRSVAACLAPFILPGTKQDIVALEVAMDDPYIMQVREALGNI